MKKMYILNCIAINCYGEEYNEAVVVSENKEKLEGIVRETEELSVNEMLLYFVEHRFKIPTAIAFAEDKSIYKDIVLSIHSVPII